MTLSKRARLLVASGATGVMAVAVVVGVLLFGVVSTPGFESLREHPDERITGTIAYVVNAYEDNGSSTSCVWVVPASGVAPPTKITCDQTSISDMHWLDDGRLVLVKSSRYQFQVYDVQRGGVTDTVELSQVGVTDLFGADSYDNDLLDVSGSGFEGPFGPAAHDVTVSARGDESGENSKVLVRVEKAPGDYGFDSAGYAPDRQWIWIGDSEGRVLVAPGNGGAPRALSTLGSGNDYFLGWPRLAWYQAGHTEGLLSLDELKRRAASPNLVPGRLNDGLTTSSGIAGMRPL
jgi:hypothetical protein